MLVSQSPAGAFILHVHVHLECVCTDEFSGLNHGISNLSKAVSLVEKAKSAKPSEGGLSEQLLQVCS